MNAHVVLYRTRRPIGRQRWRFRCVAANGRVLTVSSEAYANRGDALAAAELAHPGLEVRT